MNNISSLTKYRRAKIIIKDLAIAIRTMNLAIDALSYFSKYIPVMETISVLQNNKTLLEIHLNKQNKILKNKGKEE